MKKILLPVLILSLVAGLQAAEKKKTTNDYIVDLKSDDDATVISASQNLGASKAKEAIDPMIEAMKSHQNPKVRIAIASGLGNMDTKNQPTTALSEVVKTDDDNSVVYASLLAILNLKDFGNPDAKAAVEFCEKNKASDEYITDVVKKIHEALDKNQKK
ncbi:MAG: HEAT repeat domain-containing protein [Spirochaetia bacterium]|nr:HEAT repeat domain-containing protein [Spirochaetia bacterium]